MQTVQLRDRRQITLPPKIVAECNLQVDDELSIRVRDGVIELTPIARKLQAPVDVSQYLGAVKCYGSTPEEMDAYIRAERDSWDR